MLICSTGGHFRAIQELKAFWETQERIWVTFDTPATQNFLVGEKVYWAWSPTNRNLKNLVRNFLLAWKVLSKERPFLVISTGAGVAVPFLIISKILGSKTVFIESITRVKQLSLTARLVLPFLDVLYVHWEQLKSLYPMSQLII